MATALVSVYALAVAKKAMGPYWHHYVYQLPLLWETEKYCRAKAVSLHNQALPVVMCLAFTCQENRPGHNPDIICMEKCPANIYLSPYTVWECWTLCVMRGTYAVHLQKNGRVFEAAPASFSFHTRSERIRPVHPHIHAGTCLVVFITSRQWRVLQHSVVFQFVIVCFKDWRKQTVCLLYALFSVIPSLGLVNNGKKKECYSQDYIYYQMSSATAPCKNTSHALCAIWADLACEQLPLTDH